MTLESDTKFIEKLTLGSKNDIRDLVDFNRNSSKSENLHLYLLLLSTAYKVSAKKVQKKSEEKLNFCLENDMRNLVNFNSSSEMSKTLHLDRRYVIFEVKNTEGLCVEK